MLQNNYIIPDYITCKEIKSIRNKLKMTQKEFASFQVEQRAVILKRIEPHSTLAGKLQFFLGADATKSIQQNTFNCFRKSSTQVVRW